MLTFAEEILLLALDDRKGVIKPMPAQAMRFALAGALLMELAIVNRIDTDLQTLKVINKASTGDELLDETLGLLQSSVEERSTSHWLNEIAWQGQDLQELVLHQLVEKGVLKVEDRRILWVFAVRRYPMMDNREVKEVKARLREVIVGDEIPDPREAVLIGLVDACQLFGEIFTQEELDRYHSRIAELARLDLIGREVAQSINRIALAVVAFRTGMV